jgi:ABC-type multidrug transport system fused ATPase/permease subunit
MLLFINKITEGDCFMSLIKCPECKKKISDTVSFCPNCGATITDHIKEQQKGKGKSSKKIIIISLIIFLILVVIGLATFFIGKQIKSNKEEKLMKEQVKKQEEQFYNYCDTYSKALRDIHEYWLDYTSQKRKVWYNCIWNIESDETDDFTKDSKGAFYSDFNDALSEFSSSSYVESLLDECVEDVGKEKDLYAKLARIKSKSKNILELKKIISSTHETVTNMYKMEESYGYNYKEYDEKMDNYLEDITDAQTKIDSKKEER